MKQQRFPQVSSTLAMTASHSQNQEHIPLKFHSCMDISVDILNIYEENFAVEKPQYSHSPTVFMHALSMCMFAVVTTSNVPACP